MSREAVSAGRADRFHARIVAAALVGALSILGTAARAAEPKEPAPTRGVRISSPAAVQETVEAITARDRARPARRTPRLHPEHEVPRGGLPQNPLSPRGGQWPPSPAGEKLRSGGPYAPQTLGTSFTGATLPDTLAFPPDTMGAVGPTQFIVALNGRLRSFNKTTGTADGVLNVDMDTFFNSVMTPPQSNNFTSDPRIRYDRLSGRWFITMIDVPNQNGSVPNRVMFAVSNSATITGATVWTLRFFQGDSTLFSDYDTLGVDQNALYIGANMFSTANGSFQNTNAYVIQKSSVLGSGAAVVNEFANLLVPGSGFEGPFAPQGVDNYDPASTQGYFIGVSAILFGELVVRRVSSPGTGSPTMSPNILVPVATTASPIGVPNQGGSIALDALDDRLFAAHLRNGRLWTAHNIQVDAAGSASSTGGRDGSRWYELQNLAGTPSVVQSGTVFDSSGVNPLSYWIPSVMVSGQGHAALGFSVSGAASFVDAATVGRLAGDPLGTTAGTPVRYTASSFSYNVSNDRWGDYSFTSLDPSDDMTMWTIQEFVDSPVPGFPSNYGVRAVKLIAPPPATPNCAVPAVVTGPGQNVTITGTSVSGSGFYDPGAGFTNRLAASVSGGVVVNSVTYNNPTSVTLNVTPTTSGLKNVTLTNPDGQAIGGTSCINVVLSSDLSITKTDGQANAIAGGTVTYTIVVSNAGPSTASGATVTDTVPAAISGPTWTCAGAGGGSCTASGSGNINTAVTLPPGGTATFTLTGTVSQAASGTLANTAAVAAPAGVTDPNPGNNSATDTDTVVRQSDLAITKTDGHAAATAGESITYTIVASNAGPSNVTGATVTDTVPAAFLTPTWTCSGAGGGTCTASGSGNINDAAVNLPAGASVTYTLSGTISGAATGNFSNTASISAPGGTTDPNSANNSATDTDPLVVLGPNNDTPFGAKDLEFGSASTDTLGPSPNDQNWFRYAVQAGRSYCVDVDNGRTDVSIRDTVLSVFRGDTTTLIGTNDDVTDEPSAPLLSRVCYIAAASEDNLARVTAGASASGTTGGFRVRVVETTLYCPWFFSGSGFESFVLIKNTTGTVHNATVRLVTPAGATLGTQSGTAAANGSYNLQVSAAPPTGFALASASGGVYIAHDGPPGSLIANVTSLSFTTGVSFDTPASPRQDFRP